MELVSFISIEDEPPDLILSFSIWQPEFDDIRSLILMRTPEYEIFIDELERGVKVSDEDWLDDEEDILDIVDDAIKEAFISTEKRLIIWPNDERLTVDQSAEKIKGENDLDKEVVKDCIMAWVEMDAQPEHKIIKQEEIFIKEIQNWVNEYYSENKKF